MLRVKGTKNDVIKKSPVRTIFWNYELIYLLNE